MKKIVEKTLEAALIKASTELNCSVADLEYEIIQNPSSGFFGLGKKDAIIVVETKGNDSRSKSAQTHFVQTSNPDNPRATKQSNKDSYPQDSFIESTRDLDENTAPKEKSQSRGDDYTLDSQSVWGETSREYETQKFYEAPKPMYSKQDNEANIAEIRKELEALFAFLPFEIHQFEVKMYDDNTLYIYIDGRDCALLIGERGYRYKALSYLLFNWINPKYGYALRLEIAEFLKNQEEMIDVYLKDIVRLVRLNGRAQTKTLDGILVYIALSKLRDLFPDKYVSVRQNEADEKYIIINDFRR
ncbi:Jag N-terminal domain-containing protein [Helicobacter cinaedi]|uniref:SpoIIIJ-associated protein n=1 Tax=Helicobacter cinaedi TaxID=213 RepID=A0A377JNY4_9HELI|nr:Jag N-terminal domain-containing protein [Helicobacter cinaedi]STP09293.1 spoIIIJ-associated protein [Helicobacter cinaedi]